MSDANDATVETLLLRLSGFRLQWRPDDGSNSQDLWICVSGDLLITSDLVA